MKTILTTAMILAIGAAPAFAQSSAGSDPATSQPTSRSDSAVPNGNGGVASVGSSADAMSKQTGSQSSDAAATRQKRVAKTGPSTSESPGVDHNEPKGAPSTASHTSPE